MARKTPQPSPDPPLYLAVSREDAEQKIAERIKKGEDLTSRPIQNEPAFKQVQNEYWTWSEYNTEMLQQLFTTPKIAKEYNAHAPFFVIRDTSFWEDVKELVSSIEEKLRTLTSIKERLELIPIAPGLDRAEPLSLTEKVISHKKVFLVHGHDEAVRESIARFLEKLDLEPIILHEQASEGRTIVEKSEHHGDVKYAVVLLTPDDVGGKSSTELKPRARQNVVLELGYFLARLTRSNVCALYKGEVEIPYDYMGVIYVPYDDGGGWRLHLAKELKAAKFPIDMNRAI